MYIPEFTPLASSFSSIIVSEIGDKTFFITAILCMTYSLKHVFIGSYLAMVLMTTLSCFFGYVLPQLLNKFYTHITTAIIFLFFGQKLVRKFFATQEDSDDEEEEAEEEVKKIQTKLAKPKDKKDVSGWSIIKETCLLTFFGEWGDRSQITTIALATEETYIVLIGSLLGHFVCTLIAVLGGKIISQKISEKWINLSGGILFIFVGIQSLVTLLWEQ